MLTIIHLKSDRNDCFHSILLKNKQKNGKTYVLFNSRWRIVNHFQSFVDVNLNYDIFYIGKFSTKDQFRIQFVKE